MIRERRGWLVLVAGGLLLAAETAPGCRSHPGAGPTTPEGEARAEAGEEDVEPGEGEMVEEWVTLPVRIVYRDGEAVLDEESEALLGEVGASVAGRGDVVRVVVDGHTDSGEAGGEELARERAQGAADYLAEEAGIAPEMVEAQGHGASRPLTSSTTAADRVQNQRVQVRVLVRRPRSRGSSPTPTPAYSPVYSPPPAAVPGPAPSPRPAAAPSRAVPTAGAVPSAGGTADGRLVPAENHAASVPLLTAAAVGDSDRRGPYLSYLERHPSERTRTDLDMSRRLRVRVLDGESRPLHDARVTIAGSEAEVQGVTHADGVWDFYPSASAPYFRGPARVVVEWRGHRARAMAEIPEQGDGQDVVVQVPGAVAAAPATLDLAFAIDTTGSMDDELRYVASEVMGIVERVRRSVGQVNVRVGAVLYRDRGDPWVRREIPFTSDIPAFLGQMSRIRADGGGDYPEDMNAGLEAALTGLSWSTGPAARVLVLIADAPPQRYPDQQYTYRHAMIDASRRGVRILPVAASGADRVVEYLFRAMGAFTSTPYVYLTDDSGIGGHHMEADTDRVTIEMFSDLLTRLLIADLRGLGMHEPSHAGQ